MDQASSLSDNSAKTLSLLGGLIAQMNSALGGGNGNAEEGLFSNLLSQSDEMQAALAAQTQATPPATASTAAQPSADAADSVDATDAPDASASDATSNLWQNLAQISSLLHKALAAIQHKKDNNHANSGTSSAPSSASATPAPTTAAPSQNTSTQTTSAQTAADANAKTASTGTVTAKQKTAATTGADTTADTAQTAGTDAAASKTPTLADLVAELLAMAQLVVKALQQQAQGGGTDATQKTATTSDLSALDALANLGGGNVATGAASSLAGNADQNTDIDSSLLAMLQTLQKDIQQLLPAQKKDTASATGSLAAALSTPATATASDTKTVTDLFTALDTTIKQAIAGLQDQQNQNGATATKKLAAEAQQAVSTVTAANVSLLKIIPASELQPAPKLSDAELAAHAQLFANVNAPNATNTTASTATTTGSVATALTLTAEKASSDSDAGSDLMSGNGNNAFMANNDAASLGSGLTAENVQAKGTYSFASTLSAMRAANGGSTGLPSAVDQVILQMNRSVKSGNDQMSMQLHPADMGKITVNLNFGSDGKVQGTVVADNPKTLDMLQKDSRSLERALQDAGLSADPGSLQFSLGGQSQQNNAGQAQQNKNSGIGTQDGTQSASDMTGLVDIGAMAETYYVTPGGVNIRV